jgi:hypothetical protein
VQRRPGGSNVVPSVSPDAAAFAFASGKYDVATSQMSERLVMIARAADGALFSIPGAHGDASTPRWAPTMGARFAWVVFSSHRPYGTEEGDRSPLRHLWIVAIDRTRLGAGDDDPTTPALFLPGQDLALQYADPQWPAMSAEAVAELVEP